MKKLMSLLILATATSAMAHQNPITIDQIKCSADKYPYGKIDIPVKRTLGAAPDEKIHFGGSTIAVGFGAGSTYEPQQIVSMEVDGNTSYVYDPKNSLYVLETNSRVRLQCYISKAAQAPVVQRSLACDSYDSKLIDLTTGRTIYDFSSNTDCQKAKTNVLAGKPFCDSYDSTLYTVEAILVHDFSSRNDCTEAIERVHQKKNFCDSYDSTLRNSDGDLIYDFSSNADCKAALN